MNSFCLITFFHVWLVSVALMKHGRDGVFLKRALIESMWKDIDTRSRKLRAPMNKKNSRTTFEALNNSFRATMFGCDEGILSDDTVLAGAIWRHVLCQNDLKDFEVLKKLVEYTRKNVVHLENIHIDDFAKYGLISLIDLDSADANHTLIRQELNKLIRNLALP
jgi:hypothetical protein